MNGEDKIHQTNFDKIPEMVYDDIPEVEDNNKKANKDDININKEENKLNVNEYKNLTTIEEASVESSQVNNNNNSNNKENNNNNKEINNIINENINQNNYSLKESIIPINQEDNDDLLSFYGQNYDIENVLKNFDGIAQEFSILEEDYLEVIQIGEIDDNTFKNITFSAKEDLKLAKDYVEKMDYEGKIISNISGMEYLLLKANNVKENNKQNIQKSLEQKNDKIYAWREIFPGNDSFFRSVMFTFLEGIILSKNKNMFRFFLYVMDDNLKNSYFKKIMQFYKLESSRVKLYLILIYGILFSRENCATEKAHSFLIKIYNSDNTFDPVLILNLKFLIYKYLKANERRIYSQELNKKMGELLPNSYIEGQRFKAFYENNLLQLGKNVEKISLLVIPYILRRDLFIYTIVENDINHIWIHTDGKENQNSLPIRLIYINDSYFIIYEKNYFLQFKNILNKFSNINTNLKSNSNNKENYVGNILDNIDDIDEKNIKESKIPINKLSCYLKKDSGSIDKNNNLNVQNIQQEQKPNGNINNNINNNNFNNNNVDNNNNNHSNNLNNNYNKNFNIANTNINNNNYINNNINTYNYNNNITNNITNNNNLKMNNNINANNNYKTSINNFNNFNMNSNMNKNMNNNMNANINNNIHNNMNVNINSNINSNMYNNMNAYRNNNMNTNINTNINNNMNNNMKNNTNNNMNNNTNNNMNNNMNNNINNNTNINMNNNINNNRNVNNFTKNNYLNNGMNIKENENNTHINFQNNNNNNYILKNQNNNLRNGINISKKESKNFINDNNNNINDIFKSKTFKNTDIFSNNEPNSNNNKHIKYKTEIGNLNINFENNNMINNYVNKNSNNIISNNNINNNYNTNYNNMNQKKGSLDLNIIKKNSQEANNNNNLNFFEPIPGDNLLKDPNPLKTYTFSKSNFNKAFNNNWQCLECRNGTFCENCLIRILIDNIKNRYTKFISENKENLLKEKQKIIFSEFLKNLLIYFPNQETKTFTQTYYLLTNNGKNIFNSQLNILKSSICLWCFKYIKNESHLTENNRGIFIKDTFLFKFPCGCVFCSEKCLNDYLTQIPIMKMSTFICACGEEYNCIKLKYLLYFAISHNLNTFKKEIMRIMFEYMKNKCCICNMEVPIIQGIKSNFNIFEISDQEIDQIFKINKFNHLVCNKCSKSKDIAKKNVFYCKMCSSEHSILNKRIIQNGLIRTNCLIF